MATVNRFEDLVAFQKSRELVREIYKSLRDCRDGGFKDQIQRASVSILSNIAEGFESGTKEGFLNYLYIAKASAGEVRAQLYVALDVGYLNPETLSSSEYPRGCKYLHELVLSCSKLVASFIEKLKQNGMGGLQRKTVDKKDVLADLMKEKGFEYKDGKVVKIDNGKFQH
ncbi:MAG: ribosomal protein [Candidatus Taylorbacteria bacterium]|nr:ribosomal protein [Candidatus Taylorbacteria bacterium]